MILMIAVCHRRDGPRRPLSTADPEQTLRVYQNPQGLSDWKDRTWERFPPQLVSAPTGASRDYQALSRQGARS